VIVEFVVFAQLASCHGQGLVDRVGDVLVVGVSEVIEDLEGFVRTDASNGVDRRQQERLVGVP
jgi:hypothetical protein